jgi:hypothetical protein
MACKLVGAIAIKWHKILGYVGPNAIKQLPKYVNGVELEELINEQALCYGASTSGDNI